MLFRSRYAVMLAVLGIVCACTSVRHVALVPDHSNAVAYWHDVGAETVNASAGADSTDEERYPAFSVDMATMHVAIYDAVSAIDRRYRPLYAAPAGDFADASPEAATAAAAYAVLQALFPDRSSHYQRAYDGFMASLAAGVAKDRGIALGKDVAKTVLAKRANDGRATALPDYVPGDAPGAYRGLNPVIRYVPYIRPFVLTSMAQFRPPPPPALDSAAYATAFNEVKDYGGKVSSRRTPEQLALARFYTEAPQTFITRNFGRFARSTSDTADAARLMAMLYAGYTDAIGACFEAKYYYNAWRPQSAIPLAETDGNPDTVVDPAWTPVLPTPPHPEYPAAHSCTAGALGALLRAYYGSKDVSYTLDSKATNAVRTYADLDVLEEESVQARIYGGMHFRYATEAGARLGNGVGEWTMQHAFLRR